MKSDGMNKKRIRRFYNNLAKTHWARTPKRYGETPITTFYDRRERSIVRRLVTVEPNSLILDLCSGPGRWVLEYGVRGATVIALDISRQVLLTSKKKTDDVPKIRGNTDFIVADAENLPFTENVFDIINCFDAFPHFPDQHRAVKEIKRVVKLGATVILEPSNSWSLIGVGISLVRFLVPFVGRERMNKLPVWTTAWNKYDTPLASKHLMEAFGLEIQKMIGVLALPIFSHTFAPSLCNFEERMEGNTLFNLLGSRIVFICINEENRTQ
ncbi:MAG: class I SAM-dependent methyltransferase [Candidatus Hodarchaeota archaeon]